MKIRTILAAAAAPTIAAAALLATTSAASAAVQQQAPSAYFYNPSGNALGGPQAMPNGYVSFAGGYLAKVTEKTNNANIVGKTITIQGTLNTNGQLTDQPNGGDTNPQNPTARVYFEGSGGGVSDGSPDGYEGQHWWANASISLNSTGAFTLTATVDPTATGWSDWNGQPASANVDLFNGAASHVRNIGLSFGGGWFFENGVTGNGGLTITSIQVG